MEDVTAIDFQPGYVVVTAKNGSGNVFFPASTTRIELDWRALTAARDWPSENTSG